MLKKITGLLQGRVRVRAESAFPERVLNICGARGIEFRELQWRSATALSFTIDRRDWRRLKQAAENLDAEVRIESVAGAPFFLGRFKRRYALLAGLAVCAALLIVNACFIWDFQVEGNEAVPTEKILRVLAQNGVKRGMFAFSIDQHDLCNRALIDLPELSWLTVNVRGCRARVVVRERIPKPEIVNESAPTNVIAARDALVTEVRALDGEARVLKGATVRKGQLLISGVVETNGVEAPTVGARFLAGKGEVWGRTWYELSVEIPLVYEAKSYTGEEIRKDAVLWGENRVKFYGKGSSNIGTGCDKIVSRTRWTLPGGFALPVTWVKETYLPYDAATVTRTRDEAQEIGCAVLQNYLLSQLGEGGSVTNTRCASAVRGDWLLVTLSAECLEQIGEVVPIPVG